MKISLLIIAIIFSFQVFSQDVLSGVYTKQKMNRIKPVYLGTLNNLKIELDKTEKDTAILVNYLHGLRSPYLTCEYTIGRNNIKNNIYYYKPVKHKIFENAVFYNPVSELRLKLNNSNKNFMFELVSSRFYIDNIYQVDSIDYILGPFFKIKYILTKELSEFLKPFYFKKYEVTNLEYREFTNWVRDSIARRLLVINDFEEYKADVNIEEIIKKNPDYEHDDPQNCLLDWDKKIDWNSEDEEYLEALNSLFLPNLERFYRVKGIDTHKLIYELDTHSAKIGVYPDTLVWIENNFYIFNEEYIKSYNWNPKFDNYPVVGVSWFQAKAFCQWKTKMLQKEIDKSGLPYKVIVDLPTEYEREYVLTSFSTYNSNARADVSYMNKLIYSGNFAKLDLGEGVLWDKADDKNGYRYTHPADISKIKLNRKERNSKENKQLLADYTENGISGLKSNVSEWMHESYQENWLPLWKMYDKLNHSVNYKLYEQKLSLIDSSEVDKGQYLLLKKDVEEIEYYYSVTFPFRYKIENEFDKLIDKDGKLIRGSNWFDETFEHSNPKKAKTFVSPSKAYSTIGFRYVIHVYHNPDKPEKF